MTRSRRHLIPRRVRSLLCNPLATAVLLAILAFDAYRLPWHDVYGGRSLAGTLIQKGILGESIQSDPPFVDAYFVREPGRLRMAFPEADSWSEMAHLVSTSPDRVFVFGFRLDTGRLGVWAITSEATTRVVTFGDFGAPPTDPERAEATRLLATWLDSHGDPAWASAFRQGPGEESRILWAGYLHNTLSLTAFLALLYSLRWIPRTPAWFRERRRRRAESRGQCPRCGYSLRGLPPNSPCPECGTLGPPEITSTPGATR